MLIVSSLREAIRLELDVRLASPMLGEPRKDQSDIDDQYALGKVPAKR
jgi:hypothetical protein